MANNATIAVNPTKVIHFLDMTRMIPPMAECFFSAARHFYHLPE
jgi:hypothetical protein